MQKGYKQVNHSIFYDLEEVEKKEYVEYIKRKIVREKNKKPLFHQMMLKVESAIKHYQTDFYVHDYNAFTIELSEGGRFVWIVYDCGSRLIRLDNGFEEQTQIKYQYFQTVTKHFYDETSKTYLVDIEKQSLKEIDPTFITKEHFTNRYGDVSDYFNEKLKEIDNKYEAKSKFNKLMSKYHNHPPKEEVDQILFCNQKAS